MDPALPAAPALPKGGSRMGFNQGSAPNDPLPAPAATPVVAVREAPPPGFTVTDCPQSSAVDGTPACPITLSLPRLVTISGRSRSHSRFSVALSR